MISNSAPPRSYNNNNPSRIFSKNRSFTASRYYAECIILTNENQLSFCRISEISLIVPENLSLMGDIRILFIATFQINRDTHTPFGGVSRYKIAKSSLTPEYPKCMFLKGGRQPPSMSRNDI